LYFIFDGIKHEIARASDISANNQSIQGQIDTLDSAITSTNTTINALSEKVGNPGAIGDDTKKSTGIYEILDEKVNNTVFEEYKTA
jgi:flagellar biosynthesis chaperone FliJ